MDPKIKTKEILVVARSRVGGAKNG